MTPQPWPAASAVPRGLPASGRVVPAAVRVFERDRQFKRGFTCLDGIGVAVTPCPVLADFSADIRYSLRSLARAPVWTAALVLTIALGIGTSASVQGFMRGLLTTDLPISGIRRVVTVFATDTTGTSGPIPFDAFTTLRNRTDIFESLGAIRESQQRVALGRRSTLMSVAAYTRDVGAVLPLPVHQGAALSHRLRYAQFPATANPEGTPIEIDGSRMAINGTTPYWLEGLYRGRAIDLWVPFSDAAEIGGSDGRVWLLGRLRPGMTVDAAQAAIDSSITRGDEALTVVPYTGQTPEAASGMFRVGALLQFAAVAVFVIACANVAAFMLARSWARARETAVRVAIGARRRQLLRQLLIDSAVISLIGGAAGLILAKWMADIVPLMFFDQDADRLVFAPDARGITMTALWCLLVTMTCGLAPLFETRDEDPSAVLQREMAGPSKAMTRVNTGLMLLQMAGCTLLVISTGLLLAGFRAALNTKAGRDLGNPALLTLEALPSPSPVEGRQYFADAVAAAHSAATISETVWAARLPGSRPAWQWVRFDPPQRERRPVSMPIEPLREPLLDRLSLPPVSGRLFGALPPHDAKSASWGPRADAGACGTVVLNEAAAKTLFDGHAIGRVLDTTDGRPLEVIGVVRPKEVRDKLAAAA